ILWVSSSVVVVQHFFFTDTATTLLYSLSLHDALPISEFIKLVAEGQRVKINVVDEAMKSKALGHLERAGADLGQVDLLLHPTNDAWCRDHGPAFLVNRDAEYKKIIVDWGYNAWGGKYPPFDLDDIIPTRIAAY